MTKMLFPKTTFYILVWLVLLTTPVWAQSRVCPTESVTSAVNVRASPDVKSQITGQLRPGECAAYFNTWEEWYEVAAPGGVMGYVSRQWTTRSAGPSEELSHNTASENRIYPLKDGERVFWEIIAMLYYGGAAILLFYGIRRLFQTPGGRFG